MLQSFRTRYMLSWRVFMKFNFRIDQRNAWVSAPIIRWFWKLFRPSEQCFNWSNSAKRHWTKSLPSMQWGYTGSLDMLEYEVMRLLISSQGAALFWGFLDLRWPSESLDRICEEGLVVGWSAIWLWWRGLGDTQRQAREPISGPCLGAKARFLALNRTQSRAVTGFLTGHNTLRRHLHLLGLLDSPLCRRYAAREETSAHILCECEALASLRHVYLGSLFLKP